MSVADVSAVHPSVLGLPLTVHVLVSLEREGLTELDAFTRKLRARTEVRQAWYVTGEADFVLRLQLAGMEAYEGFARDVLYRRSELLTRCRARSLAAPDAVDRWLDADTGGRG